jgi:hypothetical protein
MGWSRLFSACSVILVSGAAGLAQCGVSRAGVAWIDLAAGERDLPAMIGKMCSSLCEQHGRLVVLNNRYKDR